MDTGSTEAPVFTPTQEKMPSEEKLSEASEEFSISKEYAIKKTITAGILNFTLFLANLSHMKAVSDMPDDGREAYRIVLMLFLTLALLLGVALGILLLIVGIKDHPGDSARRLVNNINDTSFCIAVALTAASCLSAVLSDNYERKDTQPVVKVTCQNST